MSCRHEHEVGLTLANVPGTGAWTKTAAHRDANGSSDRPPADSNGTDHRTKAEQGGGEDQRGPCGSEAQKTTDRTPQTEPRDSGIEGAEPPKRATSSEQPTEAPTEE